MKFFPSIIDAIEYHTNCPLCSRKLEINDRDLADDHGYAMRHGYPRLSFYIDKRGKDILTIDPITNEILLTITEQTNALNLIPTYGGGIATFAPPPPKTYVVKNGLFIHALSLSCNKCYQFSYTLQVHVDLGIEKFIGSYLNSETLSIEDNAIVHEIKNIYSTGHTEYTWFAKDGSEKKATLPLIELDLKRPVETISRIRKLLIFS